MKNRRILLTGINGFVAGSVLAQAPVEWEIHGVGRSANTPSTGTSSPAASSSDATSITAHSANEASLHYHRIDLTDSEKLATRIRSIKPDTVIHTAAIANIDLCESQPALAEAMNTGVTEQLAALCREIGARLIFCSTDTVFDGKKGFYSESDPPSPINVYARTKVKAEQAVLSASDKNVVARLSLVMGMPVREKGNSFLADTLEKWKNNEKVKFPENEIRTPVDVITVGAALNELAGNDFGGIIHLAGKTSVNRYAMALKIAEATGFSPDLILSVDSNSLPGRAPRPNDASLDNSRAAQILATPMRTLSEGLTLTLAGLHSGHKPSKT